MADGDLWLISATDTIDLNGLVDADYGVQAQPGATGLGLPPVEVQYQTGAGDGAVFRSQRLSPRDIDLPLVVVGRTKAEFRSLLNRLARAIAGECTLRWDDGSVLWDLKVRRVGGGDLVWGQDIASRPELHTTITFRAGSPLWQAASPYTTTKTGTALTGTDVFTVPSSKAGTAKMYPTIQVTGPTLGFEVRNSKGEGLIYTGFIPQDEVITVDCEKGTVTNSAGQNMYSQLAPNARMISVDPTTPDVTVTTDRSSAAYTSRVSQATYNLLPNPTFGIGMNEWTAVNGSFKPGVDFTPTWDSAGKKVHFPLVGAVVNTTDSAGHLEANVTGLIVGKSYEIRMDLSGLYDHWPRKDWNMRNGLFQFTDSSGTRRYKEIAPGTIYGPDAFTLQFTATTDTGTIKVIPPYNYGYSYTAGGPYGWQLSMDVESVSVTELGVGYFDGDTPDTAEYNYQWTGTAHDSTSSRTSATPPDTSHSGVTVSFSAKNWMVV